jgi:hypothetical protein
VVTTLTENDRLSEAVAANRQKLVEELIHQLEAFDTAMSAGHLGEARLVIASLVRMRDRLLGKGRQEVQLLIDARWEQLNNARRLQAERSPGLDGRRRCSACGAVLKGLAPSVTQCELCAVERGSSIRAASAGLPTLGKARRK